MQCITVPLGVPVQCTPPAVCDLGLSVLPFPHVTSGDNIKSIFSIGLLWEEMNKTCISQTINLESRKSLLKFGYFYKIIFKNMTFISCVASYYIGRP